MRYFYLRMSSPSSLSVLKSHSFLMESLDTKQQLFVEARARGSVPVVAARIAGYKDPDEAAIDLMKDSSVRMATEAAIRLDAQKRAFSKDDVRQMLHDAYLNSANSTEQRQAAREIGLLEGHYEEKKKLEITGTIDVIRKQMTTSGDEQLARIAAYEGDFEILDFDEEVTGAVPRLSS